MPRESRVQRVVKKGRSPFYRLRHKGQEHHLGTNRREAYQRASEILGPEVRGKPVLISEAVAEWSREFTNPFFVECLQPWVLWAGDTEIEEIEPKHLHDYAKHLESKGLAPSTIRKRMVYAKKVLTWLVDRGLLHACPPSPKLPKALQWPKDVPNKLLASAFASLPDRAGKILRFIAETGCRPSEATRLRWNDVDMKRRVAVLSDHKSVRATGRPRTLYLTEGAYQILSDLGVDGKGLVFRNRKGRAYTSSGLRSILRRRGIKSVYALRHTAAQSWLDQGTPLEDIAKLLGHSDLRTVQAYARVRDERSRSVAASLSSPLQPRVVGDVPSSKGEVGTERRGNSQERPPKSTIGTDPSSPQQGGTGAFGPQEGPSSVGAQRGTQSTTDDETLP